MPSFGLRVSDEVDARVAERNHKLKKPSRQTRQQQHADPLAIVGVGVCAASLESLLTLFRSLDGIGAAYVVAVRQQDGLTVDTVLDALTAQTSLPVRPR